MEEGESTTESALEYHYYLLKGYLLSLENPVNHSVLSRSLDYLYERALEAFALRNDPASGVTTSTVEAASGTPKSAGSIGKASSQQTGAIGDERSSGKGENSW